MKIPITLILPLLLVKGIYAQETQEVVLPPAGSEITFSNIVQVDNTSNEELHRRAKKWAAYTCDVITLDDTDEVVARGTLFLKYMNNDMGYTIKIKVKDNRYKYEIANLIIKSRYQNEGVVEYPLGSRRPLIGKKKFNEEIAETFNHKVIASLEQAMKNPLDDNW